MHLDDRIGKLFLISAGSGWSGVEGFLWVADKDFRGRKIYETNFVIHGSLIWGIYGMV